MSTDQTKDMDILRNVENVLAVDPEGPDSGSLETALTDLQKELSALAQGPDIATLEQSLQLLGTAVGKNKGWQSHFRACELLAFAVEMLCASQLLPSLRKQALRVVGNSVADNDLNREVVTKSMRNFVPMITETDLSTTVLIVLFNLCNDFDPAKAAAATLRLDTNIINATASGKLAPEALDYAVDLITWTTGKLTAEQLKDSSSISTFTDLLELSLGSDNDDHTHEYIALIVHYLQDPEFQEPVCSPEILDKLVTLLLSFESECALTDPEAVFKELAITKTEETSAPSTDTTILLLVQLVNVVSGISATNAFAQHFTLTTPAIERVRSRITVPTTPRDSISLPIEHSASTVALCVMLGNLAMSDAICTTMVSTWHLHVPLTLLLHTTHHSALLYATVGLLRHLAFPEPNRIVLGDAGLFDACQACLEHTSDPAVTGEVAALLGKLVTNTLSNIERIVGISHEREQSCLATLLTKSLEPPKPLPSTSMKNLSIETGRTIVSILRRLGRADSTTDITDLRRAIFSIPHIALPLARLVRQRFYPDARSEGLLGLGLMAQSGEGAACVMREVEDDEGLLDAIGELGKGEDGGGGVVGQGVEAGSASGRDYQNAVVLLQALQNNGGDGGREVRERIEGLKERLGRMMV